MTLLQLVQSQVPILEQMLRLSEKQWEFVQLGDMTLLNQELLPRKLKVYEMFEAVRRQLEPYQNIEPQDRTWENEQQRLDCDAAIRKNKELLVAILKLEQQCEIEMLRQRAEIRVQLNKMDTSGKAAVVYAKQNVIPVSPKTLSPARFDYTE